MYNSKLGQSEPNLQLLCRLLWEAARLGDLQVMSTACVVCSQSSVVQALIRSIHFVQSKRVKEAAAPKLNEPGPTKSDLLSTLLCSASKSLCPKIHMALFLDWENSHYHNRTPLHGQFLHDSFLHCFA